MGKVVRKIVGSSSAGEPVVVAETVKITEENSPLVKAVGRVVRGHKYDGKAFSFEGDTRVLVLGKNPPKSPRNPDRPSVMFRIYKMVQDNPGITISGVIQKMLDSHDLLKVHPSEYARKDQLEAKWCFDYIKGAISARHLDTQK